ncbi:MAG: MarR family transcriptional regulator [Chloroflexota bacterium]
MTLNQVGKHKAFVEEVGVIFEQTGLSRMAGRIFGWLLIAEPPHQSTAQLAEELVASKASISTMTRLLIRTNLIEKVCLPGVRQDYFRLRGDAWRHIIRHGLQDEISLFRNLAEHGLALSSAPAFSRERLKEMRDIYTFLEQEFPALVNHWEKKTRRSTR